MKNKQYTKEEIKEFYNTHKPKGIVNFDYWNPVKVAKLMNDLHNPNVRLTEEEKNKL